MGSISMFRPGLLPLLWALAPLGVASGALAQMTPIPTPPPSAPLLDIYKSIHAHPELSHFEVRTSAIVAEQLRAAGFDVTQGVGVYPDGSRAHGVVAILKNGPGPTLLIRADMDALPIVEETGLPFASHVRAKDLSGKEVGVMHACGHDIHSTILIGVARALAASRARWHGTAMLIGQPSEETVDGAKAMLADHLYERLGRPDRATRPARSAWRSARPSRASPRSTSRSAASAAMARPRKTAATRSCCRRSSSRSSRPSSAASRTPRTPPSSP
jgi:hypothetical protein